MLRLGWRLGYVEVIHADTDVHVLSDGHADAPPRNPDVVRGLHGVEVDMAPRLYAYFVKVNGKWVRQPGPALFKDAAIRFYQTQLIYNGGCLRPVKE